MTDLKITTANPEAATLLMEILMEVDRAEAKHPNWPSCHIKQIAIVSEEAGELVRAGNQVDEGIGSFVEVRIEAIQTAATIIRLLKKLPDTELAYNEPSIIEYFENDSDEPHYMAERDDHE